ncbi:MAG: hypothetical protein HOG05_08865 [Bacteroidetes bacterium]|jgi:hypothetical protein|nr:hypothetical protein [Bacteroidota bacterium]MBT4332539.1 hypothetical protein [Candidatus Cloacimonadota bacterium]MBT5531196.1 hypothetical protein [Cytophagia bacterium]MBT3801251.1 hypothetical protein [Bacteroidota bacterium]MBT3935461.1 hypothetical protein [Bacteroidota bacterium]
MRKINSYTTLLLATILLSSLSMPAYADFLDDYIPENEELGIFLGAYLHYEIIQEEDAPNVGDVKLNEVKMKSNGDTISYRVQLSLYFDCAFEGVDEKQLVSVYEGMSNTQIAKLNLNLDSTTIRNERLTVACDNYSQQCVKVAYYSAEIDLAPMYGGYDLTWGNCCWDMNLKNIDNLIPQGMALTSHIYNQAGITNSSPSLTVIPLTLTCTNKLVNYMLAVNDPDGDQVKIEMSTANNYVQENPTIQQEEIMPGQTNAKTLDVGNPPFKTIQYKDDFSSSSPLAESIITVNEETGSVDITPLNEGMYLLAYSIKEFRGDLLLSESQLVHVIRIKN